MKKITQNKNKILSRQRCKVLAVIVIICTLTGYIYIVKNYKNNDIKASEKIIRKAAAYQLNKEPGELSDEDFAKVTKLIIKNYDTTDPLYQKVELCNIKLLEKFVNLQDLDISNISYPDPDIPKWMVILGRIHVLDLYKSYHKHYMNKYRIDLKPLEKLSKLQVIRLIETPVKDITPLAKLDNLKEIQMSSNQLDEFGIFKGGAVPETVFISNREYKLEVGMWLDLIMNQDTKHTETNEVRSPLPIIKDYSPGTFGSELLTAELKIRIETDNALK